MQRGENIKKCIRMRTTIKKSHFEEINRRFYGREQRFTAPPARRRKNEISDYKTDVIPPPMTILRTVIP